jgi:DNA-binding NarL/FixJ family response regulator
VKRIRVVVIEDNEVFRDALELLLGLREDVEVVTALGDGSSAVDVCRAARPDVLLIDYRLPGLDGIQITSAVHEACPEVAIVCLTASVTPREIEALRDAGAVDCVMKHDSLDEIVASILGAPERAEKG